MSSLLRRGISWSHMLTITLSGTAFMRSNAAEIERRDRPPFLTTANPELRTDSPGLTQEPALFPPDNAPEPVPDSVPAQNKFRPFRDETSQVNGHFADGASSAFVNTLPVVGAGASTGGLRSSSERERLLARAARPALPQDYNVKLGPLPLKVSVGFGIDFSDNIEGTNENRSADLLLRPQVGISGSLKLTKYNSITIQLGIGYLKDLGRPDRDTVLTSAGLGLANGSELSFDVKLGNFLVNFHDLPEIPQQQVDFITQRTSLGYSRFTNAAGLTILWNLNSRLAASVRYDHINTIGLSEDAKRLGSTDDRASLLLQYDLGDRAKIGVNTAGSSLTYNQRVLNDSNTYQFGGFVEYVLTDYIQVQATLGRQVGTYGSRGITSDASSLKSYYSNLSLLNNLNPYVRQSLSIGHEAQAGTASNFVEINYLRHQTQWEIVAGIRVSTFEFFEDAKESGGLFAQDIRRFGLGLSFGLDVTKKLNLQLEYSYTNRSGSGSRERDPRFVESESLDYYENRFTMEFRYAL